MSTSIAIALVSLFLVSGYFGWALARMADDGD